MSTKGKAVRRNVNPDREIRLSRIANAAETIGPIVPGIDVYALTFGQFDLADVLEHLLDSVGEAEVTLATWTAARADLDRAEAFIKDSRIKKLRFIVDRSFPTRQPGYYAQLIEKFGQSSVVLIRSHCKFMLIQGGDYRITVRTSANLNANKRLENIEITDDPALYDFMSDIADSIFDAGNSEAIPDLKGIPAVEPIPQIKTGGTIRVGR